MMQIRIEDVEDPRIEEYREIQDADAIHRRGVFIVETGQVVERFVVEGRFPLRSLLLAESRLEPMAELLRRVPDRVPIFFARQDVLDRVVGFHIHRGCLAAGDLPPADRVEALLESLEPGPRTILVGEKIANTDNVGSMFRNSSAFGVDVVLLDPGAADPLHRKSIRVSMGTTLTIPWARVEPWPAGLEVLSQHGFALFALTPRKEAVDIRTLRTAPRLPPRVAWMVGAEGEGLSEGALAAADLWVRIPMAPGADSVNVATAAAVALYENAGWRGA